MQRKNYILNSSKRQKNAFAMMMAIIAIVIVATIMTLALSLTTQTSKQSTDLYIYEQAVLLSRSATEYALLQISQNHPCTISTLNFTQDRLYDINISIQYIYDTDTSCIANGGSLYSSIKTPEQNGSVLIDVTVSVEYTKIVSEPIIFFRRSNQKLKIIKTY